MARRGWARSIVIAILASAGSGAAQLGLAYGLGIIAWIEPSGADTVVTSQGAWAASLAWATWVAATSVVIGAVSADRLGMSVESGPWVRAAWRTVIAMSAALGALVTVPLVAVPARAAQLGDNFAPHLLAGIYTVAGVVLGLFVALLALASRAVAANVFASAVWLWTLAIVVVVDGVMAGRGLGFVQLAVWKFTSGGPVWRDFYVPGALLMLSAALLIGGLAAFPAAGRGDHRVGVAISGAVGPLTVAVAYILAAPKRGNAPIEQMSAYLTAPYTIIAGLAGAVLVTAVASVPSRQSGLTPAEVSDRSTAYVSEPEDFEWPGGLPAGSASGKATVPASSRATPDGEPTSLLGLRGQQADVDRP
jgi:hypothetical protein